MKRNLIFWQILFLIIGFLGVSTATAGILEGPIQNPANSHTYYLLEPDITWTEAEAEAISLGGHLVTINDAAEQDWVWSTFSEGKSRCLWIGINDVDVEGNFVWASGEVPAYTNWTPGEPNNYGGNEDYGEMDYSKGGKWNDLANDAWKYRHYGVVEIDEPDYAPFSNFVITHALITYAKLSDSDNYYIKGKFTLDENSDGIDPLEEVVKLKVGTSTLEIPAGAFTRMGKRKYKFMGKIDDVHVYMDLKTLKSNGFKFMALVTGIDLTDTPNPVPIQVYMGNDMGQTDIWLSGILKLK